MKKIPFKGSGVALVTPYTQEGRINYQRLEQLIEMHIAHNTDAIIICGTTGEASMLTDSEQKEIITFTVRASAGRIPVIAGAASNCTEYAVKRAINAEACGADAILSVTPYYNKANSFGIYEHYKQMARAVSIPVILYNVPSRTGYDLPVESINKLSEEENITAIKEAKNDLCKISSLLCENNKICVYSGNDDIAVPVISLGGIGLISVAANIIPDIVHKMVKSALDNDYKTASEIQNRYNRLFKILFCEVNPVPVKNAMNALGYNVGNTRLPLGKMNEDNLNMLKKVLSDYRIERLI